MMAEIVRLESKDKKDEAVVDRKEEPQIVYDDHVAGQVGDAAETVLARSLQKEGRLRGDTEAMYDDGGGDGDGDGGDDVGGKTTTKPSRIVKAKVTKLEAMEILKTDTAINDPEFQQFVETYVSTKKMKKSTE